MEETLTDGYGNYWDALTGRQLDWYDLIARGIDVAGAALSHSPYYSPNDPRYQQGNYPYGQYNPYGAGVNANINAGRGGIGAGLNLSTNTLMLIVGGVILFILGTKRGR